MSILVITVMLIGHWVADFIFQSSDKIINKSSKLSYVSKHSAEYATVMSGIVLLMLFLLAIPAVSWYFVLNFWVFTYVFHFLVDYYLSALMTRAWEAHDRVGTFSITITDQIIHLVTLFLTLNYLFY